MQSTCMCPFVEWLLIVWPLFLPGPHCEEFSNTLNNKQEQHHDTLRLSLPGFNYQVLDLRGLVHVPAQVVQ